MSNRLRERKSLVLAKIEVTQGTDPTPVPATNAIKVEQPVLRPQTNTVETNEVSGSLDKSAPIIAGMRVEVTFTTLLKGSGTAGTAPQDDPLFRACGYSAITTAAAVPVAAEEATAGTVTTVTLDNGAAATAQLYRGMPIALTVEPPGALGTHMITNYTAGRVATLGRTLAEAPTTATLYQIPINVLYAPTSGATETITLYLYQDGLRYIVTGCIGNVQLTLDAGGIGRLSWRFMGILASKADASVPTTAVYQQTRPQVWRNGASLYDRIPVGVQQFTLDTGNNIVMSGDANATEGFDYPDLVDRNTTGSINPFETLVATQDLLAAYRNGTVAPFVAQIPGPAGNRVGITVPAALPTGLDSANRDGKLARNLPFDCVGDDAAAFYCFH